MFIDEIKVFASAGHGGRGCIAFCREAYRPKGGPDGGNGGRGGSVILQADHDLNNLIGQFYVPRLIAEKGHHGMGKGMDGPAGKDLIVKVPCGTLVWKLPDSLEAAVSEADEEAPAAPIELRKKFTPHDEPMVIPTAKRPLLRVAGNIMAEEVDLSAEDDVGPTEHGLEDVELVADLTVHGQQFVLCKGGRGGLGNRNFATARNQTPRFAQPGEPGTEGNYRLELRMMAEVGIVGYPNAGKSTLLTAISRARPKIAAYPFTTLTPQVGIVEFADFKRLTLCDVPGLIEGAHENVGLGHAFLRHITRCKVLVILLDMAGTDGREPWNDYQQLLNELELYNPVLLERPRLVVANKMDEPSAEANLKKFKRRVPRTPVLSIAAAFDVGTDKFKALIRTAVEAAADAEERLTARAGQRRK
ncbi:MAG: GTPase ObgE [Verrucomicrobiota bacterium]|jgi:GTP-binding protein